MKLPFIGLAVTLIQAGLAVFGLNFTFFKYLIGALAIATRVLFPLRK